MQLFSHIVTMLLKRVVSSMHGSPCLTPGSLLKFYHRELGSCCLWRSALSSPPCLSRVENKCFFIRGSKQQWLVVSRLQLLLSDDIYMKSQLLSPDGNCILSQHHHLNVWSCMLEKMCSVSMSTQYRASISSTLFYLLKACVYSWSGLYISYNDAFNLQWLHLHVHEPTFTCLLVHDTSAKIHEERERLLWCSYCLMDIYSANTITKWR